MFNLQQPTSKEYKIFYEINTINEIGIYKDKKADKFKSENNFFCENK